MRRALVAAIVCGFGFGADPAAAANDAFFGDRVGDGRADIANVLVSNDDFQGLLFRFEIVGAAALPQDARFAVVIDADQQRATGDASGAEYVIEADGGMGAARVLRWDGSAHVAAAGTATVGYFRGNVEIRLKIAGIGDTRKFDFHIVSERLGADGGFDRAPDAGHWTFEVIYTALLIEGAGHFVPLAPRAGTRFHLRRFEIRTSLGQDVFAQTFRCRATLGRRTLTPVRGSSCRWLLPRNAGGRTLLVFVTASYRGQTENFDPFEFRVLQAQARAARR